MKIEYLQLCMCGTNIINIRDAYTTVMKGNMRVPICDNECFKKWGAQKTKELMERERGK